MKFYPFLRFVLHLKAAGLSVVFLLILLGKSVFAAERPKYQTAYACEGKTLEIRCEEGLIIQPIRANYGRYSITICNDQGNLDWKVNCGSPHSYEIISKRCGQKTECQIAASSAIFEDPCPQTSKYLEVHYQCKEGFNDGKQASNSKSNHSHKSNQTSNELKGESPFKAHRPSIIVPSSRPYSSLPSTTQTYVMKATSPLFSPSSTSTSTSYSTLPQGTGSLLPTIKSATFPLPFSSTSSPIHLDSFVTTSSSTLSSTTTTPSSSTTKRWSSSNTSTPKPSLISNSTFTGLSSLPTQPNNGARVSDTDYNRQPVVTIPSSIQPPSNSSDHHSYLQTSQESPRRKPSMVTTNDNHQQPTFTNSDSDSSRPVVAPYLNDYQTQISSNSVSSHCPSVEVRGVKWPRTRIGMSAVIRCFHNGTARWRCPRNGKGNWAASGPNFSECMSRELNKMEKMLESGDSIVSVASQLSQVTRPVSSALVSQSTVKQPLYGGDLFASIRLLHKLVTRIRSSIGEMQEDNQRHDLVQQLAQYVVEISGNLLDNHNRQAWRDLDFLHVRVAHELQDETDIRLMKSRMMDEYGDEQDVDGDGIDGDGESSATKSISTRNQVLLYLMHNVQSVGELVSTKQSIQAAFSKANPNVLLAVRSLENRAQVNNMLLPSLEMTLGTAWMKREDMLYVSLRKSAPIGSHLGSLEGSTKLVFLVFRTTGSLMPKDDSRPVRPHHNGMINSKLISASLVGDTRSSSLLQLDQPVRIEFKHIHEVNVSSPRCVYWNHTLNDWSSQGCWMIATNKSHTQCACNHLATWALLMEQTSDQVTFIPHLPQVLVVISISCIIAILIFIVNLMLLIISRVKSHRQSIYKNLCCQLTVCELMICIICLRSWIQSPIAVCTIVAVCLHFLLQSVFNLIVIDCIRVYSCAQDSCDKLGKLMKKQWTLLYIIIYGLPALILAVILLVNPDSMANSSTFYENQESHSQYIEMNNLHHQSCCFSGALYPSSSLWMYLPAMVSIVLSVAIIVATIYGKSSDISTSNQHFVVPGLELKGSNFHAKVHRWQSTVYLLLVQSGFWFILIMFISSPLNSVVLAAIFCVINLVNALSVLYVSFLNNRSLRNNVRKSLTNCRWLAKCLRLRPSDNIGPSMAPSAPMTACFYSLDPSHLMSPPSPIVKLTSSSSSSSSARCLHINGRDDRSCSQETLPIHQMNTIPRHIPDVNPYAPPVPIYRHEYEDISSNMVDPYSFGQARHSASPYYYHTTRSPIYYSERKQVVMN